MFKNPLLYLIFFLMLFAASPLLAQQKIRVSGTVLESDKTTPIPGAGVIKFGSDVAVVSDAQGKFLIDIAAQDTLLIRAVGYKPLLYLPGRLPVSELRVNIVLQQDSVMLGEVQVSSRPSQEMIDRALRNMKREAPESVRNPGYVDVDIPPPPPPTPATIMSPFTMLYEMFSKDGKQNKQVTQWQMQQETELRRQEQEKERKKYNKFFKDNTGYD
ncbi:carboxypeptidase-like regulatory domain-containing protein [Pontibacter harenae]|uniref:carboxypeptidase-like regulatory domain-containing protein n=1 Tax=Pontibacter harenae TaxID=2894083 RepID=UPI001E36509A|nr:carboxypeptidase-like regulatory domain-containing protein [Pontibacter harenae]MCC9167806.1 carboxypeptidase-like regulatory domain-containing protein [Pontibacter harenae]